MTAQRAPREGAKASSVWAGPQPSLSWAPVHDQVAAQVRLSSPAGLIWESGIVQTDLPELAYHGPRLPSRTVHTWQVRTLDGAGLWSDWKAGQAFETALLRPSDWSAQWISREVPDSTRVIRSMPGDRVEWVGPGSTLSQPFTVLGDCLGAAIDLRFEDQGSPSGRVRLTTTAGEVLAETVIADLGFPPDRFSTTIVADPPLPPGSYLVQLEVDSGHIGWTHGVSEAPPVPGVSPIPLTESHIRDGEVGPGSLALGVDVTPAPAPEFRQVFRLPDRPVRARLYGTGLGYGTFFVNGQRVGDAVLEPAQTDYSHSVAYSAHDVTALLNAGSNEISVRTGRGFWSVRGVNVWGWNLASWSSEPAVIAQLEIDDATGQRTTIASGPDWSTRASDITSDLLYTGITQLHGALEHCWAPATIVPGPEGALKLGSAPPVVEAAPIRALPAADRASSDHVHDFGRVIAGTVRLTLRANGPGAVSVKYGEYLNEAGSVECENILTSGQAQVDRLEFAAASEGLTWQPEFTYKGFRYVAVQLEGGVELSDITAVPYVSRLEVTGSFDCDEQTLCWIENATAATLLNNLHGVPTDTPAYEKNGWTADGHLIAESAMRRFDLRSFLTKWLDDHVDSADEMGVVPQIVPTPGWGRRIDPAWSGSLILLAWNLYWEYGDSEVIHRYLKPMTRYLDRALEIAADADWIWPLHSWGDWLAPGTGPAPEGSAPVSTMSVLQLADRLSRMAALVGGNGDGRNLPRCQAKPGCRISSGLLRPGGRALRRGWCWVPADHECDAAGAGGSARVRDSTGAGCSGPRYPATYEWPPRLRRHRSQASATGAQRARTSRSGPDHRHSAHRTFLGCMDVLREWHPLGGMERLPQPQPLLPWFGRGMATRERRWTRAVSSRMATIRGPAARRRPCPAGVGKPLLAWPNGCGCLDQERPHLGCLGGRPPSVTSAPLAARSRRAGAPSRRTPLPPAGRANVA